MDDPNEAHKPKLVSLIKLFLTIQVLLELFDLFKTSFILYVPWKLVKLCQKPLCASKFSLCTKSNKITIKLFDCARETLSYCHVMPKAT